MSDGFHKQHWLIVLLAVVLIFGASKLRSVGSDPSAPRSGACPEILVEGLRAGLGGAVKRFKEGMRADDGRIRQINVDAHIIEGKFKNKTCGNA